MKIRTTLQNLKNIGTNLSYVKIYRDQFTNYKNYEGISHSHYFHKNYTPPIMLSDDKIPFCLSWEGQIQKKLYFPSYGVNLNEGGFYELWGGNLYELI